MIRDTDEEMFVADGTEVNWEAVFSLRPQLSLYRPHEPVDLYCPEPSMARQEFADDADINTIMKRYEVTGVVPSHGREPFYGDFADLPDFMEAQRIIMEANSAFESLPARVRREFDNDPSKFVEFASDEKNVDQMREWGLAEPAKVPDKPLDAAKPPEPAKPATEPAAPAGS